MILNVNANLNQPNTGKLTTAFNGATSETVEEKIALGKSKLNTPSKTENNTTTFQSTQNPQAGWKKLYATSLEGGSFAGYASSFEQQPAESTKPKGKNALWKQIIKEAARGSGLSTSKPSAGGDPFAKGYSTDLSSSSVEEA